jgi:hypothetical protein
MKINKNHISLSFIRNKFYSQQSTIYTLEGLQKWYFSLQDRQPYTGHQELWHLWKSCKTNIHTMYYLNMFCKWYGTDHRLLHLHRYHNYPDTDLHISLISEILRFLCIRNISYNLLLCIYDKKCDTESKNFHFKRTLKDK